MATTHTVAAGTVNTMAALNTLPIETAPAKAQVSCFTDFIELLTPAVQARRYVMWSAVNTLNNHIIAQAQQHYRLEQREGMETNRSVDAPEVDPRDQAAIDAFNEQKAAADELAESDRVHVEQGFDEPQKPIELAETLVNLRSYIAQAMVASAKSKFDLPQSIAESIAFRLSQPVVVDERKVQLLHLATQIPVEDLRRVDKLAKLEDRRKLLEVAGKVKDLAEELSWNGVEDHETEQLFDSLPAHTRYRLIGAVVKALKGALDSELKALIRFGRADAVTNRVIIKDVFDAYCAFFTVFGETHADALVEYELRGAKLPTLDELLADKQ